MFLSELTPFLQELTRQPVAFLGGFVTGIFRLNLEEEPVKSWLEKQDITVSDISGTNTHASQGPQEISID